MINFQLIATIINGSTNELDVVNIDYSDKTIQLPTKGTLSGNGNIIISASDDKVIFEVYDDNELYDRGVFHDNVAERVFSWLTDYYL